jgi:DNA invertase Pin-like site-specific DNA recombinase
MTIRAHNQARVYLRCSSARQESSLATQLTWAIAAAAERGIRLHASLEDLDYMKSRRLSKYKDLYVDDAVSGTRSNRPGFDAMLQELKADRRISHLLVYKRDRLGRPRNAVHMVFVENALQEEGIVIVTSDGTIDPTATG